MKHMGCVVTFTEGHNKLVELHSSVPVFHVKRKDVSANAAPGEPGILDMSL